MSRLKVLFAALCLAPTLALAQMATAPFDGRLKKIHDTKTISVAYRTDALPFSFEDGDKKPAGYTVDLCRSVIGVIERQIGVAPLQVKWVPVTAQTRFSAISSGQADMECGASTVTLGRMKEVGFSSLTFVDGTGLLVRSSTAGTTADRPGRQEDRRDRRHQQRARAGRGPEGQGGHRHRGAGEDARRRARRSSRPARSTPSPATACC